MKKGFTLIEAMVTIVIFAIGVLSIGLLYSVITESNIKSEQRTRGAIIFEDMLDNLRSFSQSTYIDTISGEVIALGFDSLWAWAKAGEDTFVIRYDTVGGVIYTGYVIEQNTIGLTPWDPGARLELDVICKWRAGEDSLKTRAYLARHY